MYDEGPRRPRGGNSWQSRHPQSAELDQIAHADGVCAFCVDERERVMVVPNAAHVHPTILGGGLPALYAGEIEIDAFGTVVEINNLSGTFRFRSTVGLRCVAQGLAGRGFAIDPSALRYYDPTGMTAPATIPFP